MNSITLLPTQLAAQVLPQKITPSKIICIGRNYVEHIKELANEIPDEMVVFLKPNSAISNELNAIHNGDILHYEAELSFLYQGGKFTAVALGLDLTKRDVQEKLKAKGLPWERAKAFDGSAIFSDFVSIETEDINSLGLSLTINDKTTQLGSVELMMVKPDEILKELQTFITLEDGDVVMTGTPKGVGIINKTDSFVGCVFLNKNKHSLNDNRLLTCQWQGQ